MNMEPRIVDEEAETAKLLAGRAPANPSAHVMPDLRSTKYISSETHGLHAPQHRERAVKKALCYILPDNQLVIEFHSVEGNIPLTNADITRLVQQLRQEHRFYMSNLRREQALSSGPGKLTGPSSPPVASEATAEVAS